MSKMILILGSTGTGKSTSLRNFKKGEAQVIACSGKDLPIRSDVQVAKPSNYTSLYKAITATTAPVVVIDDLNYMMVADEFARAGEKSYDKFTDFAVSLDNVFKLIKAKDTDQVFYVMAHPEERSEMNHALEFKISAGKMSKKFPIGGLANEVLETTVTEDGEFVFKVKTDGNGVKTPMGMFDTPTVPNDLKAVDKVIRDFYGLTNKETK